MKKFTNILQNLPKLPGVYRYYDEKDNLLYIGKAKNLKNRVSSYFNGQPCNERTALMISLIFRIEYTEVKTEKEALILEASLINNLQPKYNVKLKDDKSFVYIEYTKNDPIPGFFIVRRKENTSSTYFGPFINQKQIENYLKILRLAFPFCSNRIKNIGKCKYCSIGQCNGICYNNETKENYLENNQRIISVLQGKTKVVIEYLKSKINKSVEDQNYTLAAFYRDHLNNIDSLAQKQRIVLPQPQDFDLINLVYEENSDGSILGSFFVNQCREGQVVNVYNSIMEGVGDIDNLITIFLDNYTLKNGYNYPVILDLSCFA
jgi:excinuclease ABC subunit C